MNLDTFSTEKVVNVKEMPMMMKLDEESPLPPTERKVNVDEEAEFQKIWDGICPNCGKKSEEMEKGEKRKCNNCKKEYQLIQIQGGMKFEDMEIIMKIKENERRKKEEEKRKREAERERERRKKEEKKKNSALPLPKNDQIRALLFDGVCPKCNNKSEGLKNGENRLCVKCNTEWRYNNGTRYFDEYVDEEAEFQRKIWDGICPNCGKKSKEMEKGEKRKCNNCKKEYQLIPESMKFEDMEIIKKIKENERRKKEEAEEQKKRKAEREREIVEREEKRKREYERRKKEEEEERKKKKEEMRKREEEEEMRKREEEERKKREEEEERRKKEEEMRKREEEEERRKRRKEEERKKKKEERRKIEEEERRKREEEEERRKKEEEMRKREEEEERRKKEEERRKREEEERRKREEEEERRKKEEERRKREEEERKKREEEEKEEKIKREKIERKTVPTQEFVSEACLIFFDSNTSNISPFNSSNTALFNGPNISQSSSFNISPFNSSITAPLTRLNTFLSNSSNTALLGGPNISQSSSFNSAPFIEPNTFPSNSYNIPSLTGPNISQSNSSNTIPSNTIFLSSFFTSNPSYNLNNPQQSVNISSSSFIFPCLKTLSSFISPRTPFNVVELFVKTKNIKELITFPMPKDKEDDLKEELEKLNWKSYNNCKDLIKSGVLVEMMCVLILYFSGWIKDDEIYMMTLWKMVLLLIFSFSSKKYENKMEVCEEEDIIKVEDDIRDALMNISGISENVLRYLVIHTNNEEQKTLLNISLGIFSFFSSEYRSRTNMIVSMMDMMKNIIKKDEITSDKPFMQDLLRIFFDSVESFQLKNKGESLSFNIKPLLLSFLFAVLHKLVLFGSDNVVVLLDNSFVEYINIMKSNENIIIFNFVIHHFLYLCSGIVSFVDSKQVQLKIFEHKFQNLLLNLCICYESCLFKTMIGKNEAVVAISNLHRTVQFLIVICRSNSYSFFLNEEDKKLMKLFIGVIHQLVKPPPYFRSLKIEKIENVILSFGKFLEVSSRDNAIFNYLKELGELLNSIFDEFKSFKDPQNCKQSLFILLCHISKIGCLNGGLFVFNHFYEKKKTDVFNDMILDFFKIASQNQTSNSNQNNNSLILMCYFCFAFGFLNKAVTIEKKYIEIVRFLDECQRELYGLDAEMKMLARISCGCINNADKLLGKK
jgi:hypothetical protein